MLSLPISVPVNNLTHYRRLGRTLWQKVLLPTTDGAMCTAMGFWCGRCSTRTSRTCRRGWTRSKHPTESEPSSDALVRFLTCVVSLFPLCIFSRQQQLEERCCLNRIFSFSLGHCLVHPNFTPVQLVLSPLIRQRHDLSLKLGGRLQ